MQKIERSLPSSRLPALIASRGAGTEQLQRDALGSSGLGIGCKGRMDSKGLLFVVPEFGLTGSLERGSAHVRLDEPCHCDCPTGTGIQSLLMLTKA